MFRATSLQEEIFYNLDQHKIKLDTDHKDQHLLVSSESIDKLVCSADINATDSILEIGPGPGNITNRLCQTGVSVCAIELDTRFKPILSALCQKYSNLEVIYGSAMDIPWPKTTKIIANPPFSIMEPLIVRLVREKQIDSAHLILGQRFYERISAPTEHLTRTALITRGFFDIEKIGELEKTDLYPSSREKAVILSLHRKYKKKKCDFGLRLLASRLISTPNQTVNDFIRNLIGESINVKTIDYHKIPMVGSLGLTDGIRKKRLGDIDNYELSELIRAIDSIKSHFRYQ